MHSSNKVNITEETNFYAELLAWDSIKVIYILFHLIITLVSPSLFLSIIWYEKTSSNLTYRTLINQVLSHLCRLHLVGCLVRQFYKILLNVLTCNVTNMFT